jgi:hypothetical protein
MCTVYICAVDVGRMFELPLGFVMLSLPLNVQLRLFACMPVVWNNLVRQPCMRFSCHSLPLQPATLPDLCLHKIIPQPLLQSVEQVEVKLQELATLLPDMVGKLGCTRADILIKLVRDTSVCQVEALAYHSVCIHISCVLMASCTNAAFFAFSYGKWTDMLLIYPRVRACHPFVQHALTHHPLLPG